LAGLRYSRPRQARRTLHRQTQAGSSERLHRGKQWTSRIQPATCPASPSFHVTTQSQAHPRPEPPYHTVSRSLIDKWDEIMYNPVKNREQKLQAVIQGTTLFLSASICVRVRLSESEEYRLLGKKSRCKSERFSPQKDQTTVKMQPKRPSEASFHARCLPPPGPFSLPPNFNPSPSPPVRYAEFARSQKARKGPDFHTGSFLLSIAVPTPTIRHIPPQGNSRCKTGPRTVNYFLRPRIVQRQFRASHMPFPGRFWSGLSRRGPVPQARVLQKEARNRIGKAVRRSYNGWRCDHWDFKAS
jgi:hypothetical protein